MTDLGICVLIIAMLVMVSALTFSAALTQYHRLEQARRDLDRAEKSLADWKDIADQLAGAVAEQEKDDKEETFGVISLSRAQMEEMCRQYLRGREWEE